MSSASDENKARPPFGPPDCVWRQMEPGKSLPENIVPSGGTLKGDPVYIGRVYHKNTLLIGTAIPSKGVCLFLSNNSVESATTYEILGVESRNFLLFKKEPLDSRLLFNAGTDENEDVLYVGRYVSGGDTYIGWIQPSTKSLFIPRDPKLGSPKVDEKDFEIMIHEFLDRLCICPPCVGPRCGPEND